MRLEPATATDEARRLARRVAALEEGPMRARAAARALSAMPPVLAAGVLALLVREGGARHRAAMAAAGQALASGAVPYEVTAAIYAAAAARDLTEVQVLLVPPAAREGREEPADRPDPIVEALPLGRRKALARGERDRDRLARLAADGEPAVVRELLRNPRLTEALVVRIAARRPCRPETLRCIHEDRRWRVRPGVQIALAKNPFTEPAIALQILPALPAADLREVVDDRELVAAVRALARRLLVLRERGG